MHDIFRDVFIYWIFLIENNYAYLKRKHNVYAASRSIGTHNSVYTVHSPANMDTLQPVPYFTDNLICRAGHTPQLWRQSDNTNTFSMPKNTASRIKSKLSYRRPFWLRWTNIFSMLACRRCKYVVAWRDVETLSRARLCSFCSASCVWGQIKGC